MAEAAQMAGDCTKTRQCGVNGAGRAVVFKSLKAAPRCAAWNGVILQTTPVRTDFAPAICWVHKYVKGLADYPT